MGRPSPWTLGPALCTPLLPTGRPPRRPQEARPAACSFSRELPAPLSHSPWSSPSAPEEVVLALRPWDLDAEQLLGASVQRFFLFFSDPRPRDRLRLLERLREPAGAIASRAGTGRCA